jgi:hypothetical protein
METAIYGQRVQQCSLSTTEKKSELWEIHGEVSVGQLVTTESRNFSRLSRRHSWYIKEAII